MAYCVPVSLSFTMIYFMDFVLLKYDVALLYIIVKYFNCYYSICNTISLRFLILGVLI